MLNKLTYKLGGQPFDKDPFIVFYQFDKCLICVDIRLMACLGDEELHPLRGVLLVGPVVFYTEFE
jgi:hypothetical protein